MRHLLVFCAFSIALSSYAQRYAFVTYSIDQGLPQSQVTQIAQDKNGFLWVGTLGGLSKFSGVNFVNYAVEDGLLNNRISYLGFINDTLWVGHEGGISFAAKTSFKAVSSSLIESSVKVVDICQYQGKIIVATNGNGLFTYQSNKLIPTRPYFNDTGSNDMSRIRDLEVLNGILYLGTRSGLYKTEDLTHFSIEKGTESFNISGLSLDSKEDMHISTYGMGVQQLGKIRVPSKGSTVDVLLERSKAIYTDHEDNIWLSTKANGAICIRKNHQLLHLSTATGLPVDNVSCVFEDREHNIWIGTEGKGLLRFTGERFVCFSEATGLASDLVMSIVQDNTKRYWFSSYVKGITQWSKAGLHYFDKGAFFEGNTLWCSAKDKAGNLWFGSSTGIAVFDMGGQMKTFTTLTTPLLPGNKISSLYLDSKGRMWIGCKDGVCYFYKGAFFQLSPAEQAVSIRGIRDFSENGGFIYFVGERGLYRVNGSNAQLDTSFFVATPPSAYCVETDSHNRIWIGTEEGLFYLANQTLQLFAFSEDNSSNFINFICRQENYLWVGTNNGVFKFSQLSAISGIHVEAYGKQEGLVSLETNLNSDYIDAHGNFWFGTSAGLMRFNPRKERTPSTVRPGLVFNGLMLNFEEVDLKNYAKNTSSNGIPKDLTLPYSKKNLTFRFTGVSLSNPEMVYYSYRLVGFDDKWSPEIKSSEISYSNLPAGDYIVCVKVRNKYGLHSPILRVPFTISPPYYQTWWFIGLCVILTSLLILGAFTIRIRQIHRRQETERLVYASKLQSLEQQSLNASMNRHFIFNALNSIQYFINTKDRLSANRYLSQFAMLIRKNLDSSNASSNVVSLAEEIERLKLYLSLEAMRFPDRFSYNIEIDEAIHAESTGVPPMMFQPFIENSIIHGILPQNPSIRGEINFVAKLLSEELIEFIISDNGVGYSNSIRKKQLTGDHQSQGTLITSSRIELLRKISGKDFSLVGPEDRLNSTKESIGTTVKIIIALKNLDD